MSIVKGIEFENQLINPYEQKPYPYNNCIIYYDELLKSLTPFEYFDIRFNHILYGFQSNLNGEIFLPITGKEIPNIIPFNYFISNQGNVFSSKRNIIMRPSLSNSEYLRIDFYNIDGSSQKRSIHRTELMVFKPIMNCHQLVPNHINGDTIDNRLENLVWATYSENMIHARMTGLFQKGEDMEIAHRICYLIETLGDQCTVSELANIVDKTGIKTENVSDLIYNIWTKKVYRYISESYDFPEFRPDHLQIIRRSKDLETIHLICKDIELGLYDSQIAEKFGYDSSINREEYKRFMKTIYDVRNKRCYNDISCLYNFPEYNSINNFTDETVLKISEYLMEGLNGPEIAEKFGYNSLSNKEEYKLFMRRVGDIRRKRSYTNLTKNFNFPNKREQ